MSLPRLILCLCIIIISFAGSSALYANSPSNNQLSINNNQYNYAKTQIHTINLNISYLQYKIKMAIDEKNRNNSEISSLKKNIKPHKHLKPFDNKTKSNLLLAKKSKKNKLSQLKSQNSFLTKKIKDYQQKISKLKQQLSYWKNKTT